MAIQLLFTKSQNTNIHTCKDKVRSQYLLQIKIYITLPFRWHIQIVFTHSQMRLNHQDCYNPLIVRQCSLRSCVRARLFSGCYCVLFKGDMKSFVKKSSNTCGFGLFSIRLAFPTSFPSFGGVGEMMPKHCISIPFQGRDCLHCQVEY